MLRGDYPNPFNPRAHIVMVLPKDAAVTIEVFDLLGRSVLVTAPQQVCRGRGGAIEVSGLKGSPGVYYYRVTALTGRETLVKTGGMSPGGLGAYCGFSPMERTKEGGLRRAGGSGEKN